MAKKRQLRPLQGVTGKKRIAMQNLNRQVVEKIRVKKPEVRSLPDNVANFPVQAQYRESIADVPKNVELRIHTGPGLPDEYHFPNPIESSAHYRQSVSWFENHADNHLVAATFSGDRLIARSIIRQYATPGAFIRLLRVERGPLAVDLEALKNHLHDLILHFSNYRSTIQVNPYTENISEISELDDFLVDQGWIPIRQTRNFYRHSLTVDLKPGLEKIRAGFRKSLRRNINKAAKVGLECRIESCITTTQKLIGLYNTTARNRGFEQISESDRRFINRAVDKGDMVVCAVYFEGEFAGGNLIVPFGHRVLLEWGAFSELAKHRKYPLAHLADWESIVWARENGFTSLDFSGYWLDRGDDDPINHYKSGFSKDIINVMPEYDYSNFSSVVRSMLNLAKYGQKFLFQARKVFG